MFPSLLVALTVQTAVPTPHDLLTADAAVRSGDEDAAVTGPALRAVAVRLELMDPRETPYYGAGALVLVQDRYRRLKDAPALWEVARLPHADAVVAGEAFGRAYAAGLAVRCVWESDRAAALGAALREQEGLNKFWGAALGAHGGCYYVPHRRECLARVRDAVGPEAFERGQWPPFAPAWTFTPR